MRKIIFTQLLVVAAMITYAQNQSKMDVKSKLGSACTLDYNVTDVNKAISFYEQLNYKVLDKDKGLISDGTVLIHLKKADPQQQELTFYNENPGTIAKELKASGVDITENGHAGYRIKTTEGYIVNIVKTDNQIQQPGGKSLITMSPSDFGDMSKYPNPKCGAFGEYSIPVADLDKSMAFWEKLGFKSAMKEMAPYPHAILTDGLFIIGLHQTNQFNAPGLTYFSANMGERIKQLKSEGFKDGMPLDANNEIFRSPDGYALLLFGL
jgi:predicted lactoylglutathione lyase